MHSVFLLCVTMGVPFVLSNDLIKLELGFGPDGAPVINQMVCSDGKTVLSAVEPAPALSDWLPKELLPEFKILPTQAGWRRVDDEAFVRAETEMPLARGLVIHWAVELARQGSIIRLHAKLSNTGDRPELIPWFPIWNGVWGVPGGETLRGWRALSFEPVEHGLEEKTAITWHSHLHSSDKADNGMNPYWVVAGDKGRVYFGIEWCGGWRAKIDVKPETFAFHVCLPPDETQLILNPGETIDGPALMMAAVPESDERTARAAWFRQRAALGKALYGGPAPAYPVAYNNWYTTRFDVDAAFLKRQLDAMEPYHFDAFIIDAGWYAKVGDWTPAPGKFAPCGAGILPAGTGDRMQSRQDACATRSRQDACTTTGEFEEIMKSLEERHVMPGIWSCPQFVDVPENALPPEVDQPPTCEKFIHGSLLDLAGCGFDKRLADHVAMLRNRYHAGWWKYDQLLFAPKTRAGVMRNVLAFQNALKLVRARNPELVIENCQSGGRMINEFTMLCTQSQWLKDGGGTGREHARDNIRVALGALEFVFPWAANRWTNNFDRMDPNDDELTRYYCRSAMAGTWGIVADLGKISDRQRNVIVREIGNYRRLNDLKKDCNCQIFYPHAGVDFAGIIFLTKNGDAGAALVYRWDKQGAFEARIPLSGLLPSTCHIVEGSDSGSCAADSLTVPFSAKQMSALVFLRQ